MIINNNNNIDINKKNNSGSNNSNNNNNKNITHLSVFAADERFQNLPLCISQNSSNLKTKRFQK